MFKQVVVFFLFFSLTVGKAQQDSIRLYEYQFLRTVNNITGNTHESFYKLNVFPDLEISYFDKVNNLEKKETLIDDVDDDNSFHWNPKNKNQYLLYKDYKTNAMYFKDMIAFNFFLVKDSLNLFTWEIYSDTKEILGYTCQLAKTNFRGRVYNAWFTPKFPAGGPWKFDGLPGMILFIQSEDKYISFEVLSIKSKFSEKLNDVYPFENKKKYSWDDFKKLYKKKAINLGRYNSESSKEQYLFIMPRKKIEIYIEENDKDYNSDKQFEKSLSESNKN